MTRNINIIALKNKYPKLHLHYVDNTAWMLLKEKPSDDASPAEIKKLLITDGTCYQDIGYMPYIMERLCSALGITADSI